MSNGKPFLVLEIFGVKGAYFKFERGMVFNNLMADGKQSPVLLFKYDIRTNEEFKMGQFTQNKILGVSVDGESFLKENPQFE